MGLAGWVEGRSCSPGKNALWSRLTIDLHESLHSHLAPRVELMEVKKSIKSLLPNFCLRLSRDSEI
jgi:hypothetical protein